MRIILFTAVFFLFIFSAIAQAHPPTDIKLTFDPESKILHAVITHPVSNTKNHYIKKVDVSLNGKEILTQQLKFQENYDNVTLVYRIPDAVRQDTLSVEAYCSISGKIEKEIKIAE